MSKTAAKANGFSIAEMAREADKGHEFELTAPDGKTGTGMFWSVVGQESSIFRRASRKLVDRQRKEDFERQKKGLEPKPRTTDDDIAASIEHYAECSTGWRNMVIDEEADGPDPLDFTPANVKRALSYDFVRMQVEKEIFGIGDFTTG